MIQRDGRKTENINQNFNLKYMYRIRFWKIIQLLYIYIYVTNHVEQNYKKFEEHLGLLPTSDKDQAYPLDQPSRLGYFSTFNDLFLLCHYNLGPSRYINRTDNSIILCVCYISEFSILFV